MITIYDLVIYATGATILCCLLVLIYYPLNKITTKIQPEDIIIMTILISIAGLRYEVGSDYTRYFESAQFAIRKFSDLSILFSPEVLSQYSFEIGYEFLSVIVGETFNTPYAIFWIVGIILYIPTITLCRKKTANCYIAFASFILLGYFGLTLNVMKQALAMLFVVLFTICFNEKKYLKSAIYAIVAISFHTTAIVAILCIMICFWRLIKPTYLYLTLMIAAGLVLRFGSELIFSFGSDIEALEKYTTYMEGDESARISRSFIWIGALLETVLVIFICFLSIKNLKKLHGINKNVDLIITIIMIGIPFSIFGISKYLWIANRFAKFLFVFLIALVPILCKGLMSKGNIYKLERKWFIFWIVMIGWHFAYSVLLLDNSFFSFNSILFASRIM